MRTVFIAVYLTVIIHAPLVAVLSLNHYSQMQYDSRLTSDGKHSDSLCITERSDGSFAVINSNRVQEGLDLDQSDV